MLYSLKVRNKTNTGDTYCNPSLYFDLGHVEELSISSDAYKEKVFFNDIVIIGGGGLINFHPDWNRRITEIIKTEASIILWGAGENTHFDDKQIIPSIPFKTDDELIAIRDFNHPLYNYLPCVSCMNKVFDTDVTIGEGVGIVKHKDTNLPANLSNKNYPVICNNTTIEEITDFIKDKRVIYTNTFHGAYWAMLMDKVVIIFNPFSTRFLGFKYRGVTYFSKYDLTDELVSNLKKKIKPKAYKTECRKLNQNFYEKVMKRIHI